MRVLFTLLLTALLALPAWSAPAPAVEVALATYYDHAPFHHPDGATDLTRELAALLTARSGGRFHFVATLLPKKRIENMAQFADWQGVVAWLNPRFFGDEAQTQYQWSEAILMEEDLVLSHVEAPVVYTGPASLRGKLLGGVLNYRYEEADAMVARQEMRRSDAPSLESNIRKLMLKRVDVVFVPHSALPGLRQRIAGFDRQLLVAPLPRNHFSRHLLLTRGLPPELVRYVRESVPQLGRDPEWRALLAAHRLEKLLPPRR